MAEIEYKNPFSIRGDSLYCPLAFSLDTYWNCSHDCHHCYFRRLNRTWGTEQRIADPEVVRKIFINGRKAKNPKTPIAWALKNRTAVRFGNKSDPFQSDELKHQASGKILYVLKDLEQETVIQTRCSDVMMKYEDIFAWAGSLFTYMPVISPGLEKDWEILEKKGTTHPVDRLEHAVKLDKDWGVPWGVNGEPFIPGYHSTKDFEDAIKLVKSFGGRSYNTYNFHFNDFVAKNLHSIGIDIEKIWYHNQDSEWRPILQELIQIAKKHNVRLGCPDFVNSGPYVESCNTCCGLEVQTPCKFNVMGWKRQILLNGRTDYAEIFLESWDGIGDFSQGVDLFLGKTTKMYTLKDAGITFTPQEEEEFLKTVYQPKEDRYGDS